MKSFLSEIIVRKESFGSKTYMSKECLMTRATQDSAEERGTSLFSSTYRNFDQFSLT